MQNETSFDSYIDIMKAVASLFLFITAVYTGSAVLVLPLHQFIGIWIEYPIHKLLGHLTLISGLAGSFIYLSLNGILNKAGCGYQIRPDRILHSLIAGLFLGNLILFVIEIILLALNLHDLDPDFSITMISVTKLVISSAIVGLIIGLLEETIFRGAIQGVLMKHLNVIIAVFLTSLTYAALHFIKVPALPADVIPDWQTGLALTLDGFNKGYFITNIDKFITLFLLGVLLGTLRVIHGNIIICIGLHAGLVMMMKISRKLTDYVPGSELEYLVNYTDHQLGWLSSVVLILSLVIYLKVKNHNITL